MLLERYGAGLAGRLNTMFAEAGLPHVTALDKVPNSRRALVLGELARDRGVYHELHPRPFEAYWARGLDIGDEHVLLEEGSATGLEEDDIREAWRDPQYTERVAQQTARALEVGAGGVPAWLVDDRLLVPGAQPHELFERVLERLGHRPLPA